MTIEEIIVSRSTSDFNKLFKFHASNFKRWQPKMLIFLTIKKAAYVLKDDMSVIPASSTPSRSNDNGKTTMDTDVSGHTKKVELEKHTTEHVE
jgi:hypothetical protein